MVLDLLKSGNIWLKLTTSECVRVFDMLKVGNLECVLVQDLIKSSNMEGSNLSGFM